MAFVWIAANVEHIAKHRVLPADVEACFAASDFLTAPVATQPGRHVASGTVGSRMLQVVFALSGPDEVFAITAYWVSSTRRKP